MIIFWMAYALAMGAAACAVSQAYLGQPATVRGSYRKVGEKFWRLVGMTANLLLRICGIMLLVAAVVGGAAGGLFVITKGLTAGSGTPAAAGIMAIIRASAR